MFQGSAFLTNRCTQSLCLLLLALSLPALCVEPPDYTRGENWQQTMLETRLQYQMWRLARFEGQQVEFGPWYAATPEAQETFDEVAAFAGTVVNTHDRAEGGGRLWHHRADFVDGTPNALTLDNASALYLTRKIVSSGAVSFDTGFGSDDGIKVWLNGTLLLSNDAARSVSRDADIVRLDLREGENTLLLKIYNRTGDSGFYFSLAQDPAASLWDRIKTDYPIEAAMMARDLRAVSPLAWFVATDVVPLQRSMITQAISQNPDSGARLREELAGLADVHGDDIRWLSLYIRSCAFLDGIQQLERINLTALRRAIEHLSATYPEQYLRGPEFLNRLDAFEGTVAGMREGLQQGNTDTAAMLDALKTLEREALLANPLLDFEEILVVRRNQNSLGLPQNWQGNCSLPRRGYDDAILTIAPFEEQARTRTVFKPESDIFVGDLDLHFDGDKMLLSMLGSHNRWQIWEMNVDGSRTRQITPGIEPDVDNYDACYLPDGRIIFASTRIFQGIPCVSGSDAVANLFIMDSDGGNIRQLCFDQDHNWGPTVLNNGRVLFTRWEYSDTAHYFTRLLFHMNPDGTNQVEYYGSNSYWPNSMFYARPIPDHPTKIATIVSGHHGVARMGELIILDPAKGRHEADGVVQRIPGYGQPVEPVIVDHLVDNSWPKFLHPWPLSEHYFLVSCKPDPNAAWGIYLVDVFDNMLLLHEQTGHALLEPIPLRSRPAPPRVPDRVNLDKDYATVYLMDVYEGPGLRNVPRGTVESLRLYSFHYAYQNMGGHEHVGVEGPWDVRRILGTVPVLDDGSAYFKVPANTPIAVQPLDKEGKALQVMRSWFTAMPGEVLSCVGCHESQNTAPPVQVTQAARRSADDINPWYGMVRGFSFRHEVQPVLDRHCVGCHGAEDIPEGRPDFTEREERGQANFNKSYLALHPYVRRPGPESDYHLQIPLEWHANTSELVQMLQKGHHGVELDEEAWDRLVTWIDLNVPDHGRWSDHATIPRDNHLRRAEMRAQFACLPEDPTEDAIPVADYPREFIKPSPVERQTDTPTLEQWPFDIDEAVQRQAALGAEIRRTINLGDGVSMEFALIPPGVFVMGGHAHSDEYPPTVVAIDEPFWMGISEVTNEQYGRFNPDHNSRYINQHHKDHTTAGYPANKPDQPVIRISWHDALDFTGWLTDLTGESCTLPCEAQWEWACRAGSADELFFGDLNADFSAFANLADYSMRRLAVSGVDPQPIPNPTPFQNFLPQDARFDDGERIVCAVAKYAANPWGLHDMHGNVSEWTLSAYRPYPYNPDDGRNELDLSDERVVRGGSWRDRPMRARSAFRLGYQPWQGVFNVGFRVIIPVSGAPSTLAQTHNVR